MFVIKRDKVFVAVCRTEARAIALQSHLWTSFGRAYTIVEVKEIREIMHEPQKPINAGLDEEQKAARKERVA
jgi:hypothetical protein